MITTISGNIGFAESLDTLKEQFSGSDVHQQKIAEFGEEFGGWRRCRGDGNCFYRAAGFAIFEGLLVQDPSKLKPILQTVRASAAGEVEALLSLTDSLCALESRTALERWYRSVYTDATLDAQLVRAIRLVAASFLTSNQEVDFNGLPLNVYVEASHGMSIEAFRSSELLTNGIEAESVALALVPMAFKLKLEIIQLDRSNTAAQRYSLPEGADGEALATLLFKPGHYDIFYRKALATRILSLQDQFNVLNDCKQKLSCPICMTETDSQPLPCGCAYCEECLEGYRSSGARDCAVCGKPLPEEEENLVTI